MEKDPTASGLLLSLRRCRSNHFRPLFKDPKPRFQSLRSCIYWTVFNAPRVQEMNRSQPI
ncbi:hypothetical protein COLO4_33198 [Corchorus olitorius]|uniref:Uncharacterized protein n=1 Tax=Corchorus olitorius TaxID=93759 RepID=A0A1R3GVJ5_9ROSI|nr:hypothetical protein COLO4_33198 [Corchorus olitorius]